jgi:putative N6-adenine-specific DNA methylase
VFASDRGAPAVAKCRANALAAKVDAWLAVEVADVLAREAPAPAGTLVANPPYGVRQDELDRLAAFYPKLGDALKRRFAGWHAWLLTGDLRLAKLIRLKVDRRIPLWNGAIECRLFGIPLVAGSNRPATHEPR